MIPMCWLMGEKLKMAQQGDDFDLMLEVEKLLNETLTTTIEVATTIDAAVAWSLCSGTRCVLFILSTIIVVLLVVVVAVGGWTYGRSRRTRPNGRTQQDTKQQSNGSSKTATTTTGTVDQKTPAVVRLDKFRKIEELTTTATMTSTSGTPPSPENQKPRTGVEHSPSSPSKKLIDFKQITDKVSEMLRDKRRQRWRHQLPAKPKSNSLAKNLV